MAQEGLLAERRAAARHPERMARRTIGDNILIAWNASREARRAVSDAMSLLTAAKSVTVLVIDGAERRSHGQEPGADLALQLARHGVHVDVVGNEVRTARRSPNSSSRGGGRSRRRPPRVRRLQPRARRASSCSAARRGPCWSTCRCRCSCRGERAEPHVVRPRGTDDPPRAESTASRIIRFRIGRRTERVLS